MHNPSNHLLQPVTNPCQQPSPKHNPPLMSAYRMMCRDVDGSAFSVYAFQPEKLQGYERTVQYVLDKNEARRFKAMAVEQRRIGPDLSQRIHKSGGVLVQTTTPDDDFDRWQRPGLRAERPYLR